MQRLVATAITARRGLSSRWVPPRRKPPRGRTQSPLLVGATTGQAPHLSGGHRCSGGRRRAGLLAGDDRSS